MSDIDTMKQEFFAKAIPAALDADHIWPEYACCEAALESNWGGRKRPPSATISSARSTDSPHRNSR
jgi:hypothetical protein